LKEEVIDFLLWKTFLCGAVYLSQDKLRNDVDRICEIRIVAILVLLMVGNSKYKAVVTL
jgi:hypothetical protein